MPSTLCASADAATREADATNTKGAHNRAMLAHEKAAEYADEVGDTKLANKHKKQMKVHKSAVSSASSSSSDSGEKDNPLLLWTQKQGG
jgi:hypothetical protein